MGVLSPFGTFCLVNPSHKWEACQDAIGVSPGCLLRTLAPNEKWFLPTEHHWEVMSPLGVRSSPVDPGDPHSLPDALGPPLPNAKGPEG
jgi:hypothetical protein